MRELNFREFDCLCLAVDTDKKHLTMADFIDEIRDGCKGPRTAERYAKECVFRLVAWGMLEVHNRRNQWFRATRYGRRYLSSPAPAR